MAKDVKIIIGGDSKGAEQAISNVVRSSGQAADFFKKHWLAAGATVAAVWATTSKAIDLAKAGAAFQSQSTSFANLAASYGKSADKIVADLQRVSGETLSIQQTIEQAGKAMVLGVGADYLPKLMEMAKASARITGETTEKAFNDLVEGVAKGSSELLNNLGIIVRAEDAYKKFAAANNLSADALTAEQKQQAILNEVLEKGNDIVERAGTLAKNDAEKFAEFGAAVDDIGKSIGIMLAGPMADLAIEMKATVKWLEAYKSGQIGFWEWATTGADEAAEKLKKLQKTNLDASVTPEGLAIAKRKAEETARKAAEAAAKATAEAADKANQAREKELEEIRKHNDRILDIEKKRIDKSLQQEEDRLKSLTDQFQAAIDRHNSIVEAGASIRKRLSEINAADKVGSSDPVNQYLENQDELKRKEEEIRSSFMMSAEEKAKALADLIDLSKQQAQAVTVDGQEIISSLQAQDDYLQRKKRLEEEISTLLDTEEQKRFDAAVSLADGMNEAQTRANAFKAEIESLETVLDRLNNKEITINFRANGVSQLMGGIMATPGDGVGPMPQDPNSPMGTYSPGGNHVPGDGVGPMPQAATALASSSNQSVTVAPVFNLTVAGGDKGQAQMAVKELARLVIPEINKLKPRFV